MTYYKKREWNVICDVCGRRYKSGIMRKRWDGFVVCPQDYETDHPQKYIQSQSDPIPVNAELIRAEPTDTFITVCTAYTSQAIPGIGIPGCIIPSRNNNLPYHGYGTL